MNAFVLFAALCTWSGVFGAPQSFLSSKQKEKKKKLKDSSEVKDKIIKFLDRSRQNSQEVKSYVGASVKLDCRVKAAPVPSITWTKDEKPFNETSYRLMYKSIDFKEPYVLVLDKLLVADSGRYRCIVKNSLLTRTQSFDLVVEERLSNALPIIESLTPRNATIYVGESVTFSCQSKHVKGVIPFVKWERHRFSNNSAELSQRQYKTVLPNIDIPYHEQEEPYVLERMENHTIQLPDMIKNDITSLKMDHSDSSELTLQRVSLKESGLYVCVVFNNMGYTKMNVTLEVLAIPEPTNIELERMYITKYSNRGLKMPLPLSIMVLIPLCVVIICLTGYVYWRGEEERKLVKHENKLKEIESVRIKVERELTGQMQMDQYLSRKRPMIGVPPRIIYSAETSQPSYEDLHQTRKMTVVSYMEDSESSDEDEEDQQRPMRKLSSVRQSVVSRTSVGSRKRMRTTSEMVSPPTRKESKLSLRNIKKRSQTVLGDRIFHRRSSEPINLRKDTLTKQANDMVKVPSFDAVVASDTADPIASEVQSPFSNFVAGNMESPTASEDVPDISNPIDYPEEMMEQDVIVRNSNLHHLVTVDMNPSRPVSCSTCSDMENLSEMNKVEAEMGAIEKEEDTRHRFSSEEDVITRETMKLLSDDNTDDESPESEGVVVNAKIAES